MATLSEITITGTISTGSIRELIIQSLINRADIILIENGYKTNIGTTVYRAIPSIDPDALPAIVIWPQPDTENQRQYGCDNIIMSVRLEGLMKHGSSNASVIVEKMLGDLRKAFTDPSIKSDAYGTLIDDIYYSAGGTDSYPKESDIVTGCNAILNIKYKTLTGNPYSQ